MFLNAMLFNLQAQAEKSPEVPTVNLHLDEELLPFRPNTLDLVVSSLRYATKV